MASGADASVNMQGAMMNIEAHMAHQSAVRMFVKLVLTVALGMGATGMMMFLSGG